VGTLMRRMGIEALYRKPRTSIPNAGHRVYPYLLSGLDIERANQAWSADITYCAPGSRRHPERCCRGASMSGMHLN
jgi:putative transposase